MCLDLCHSLETDGYEITYLPIQQARAGFVWELEGAMRDDKLMVSIMAVNTYLSPSLGNCTLFLISIIR